MKNYLHFMLLMLLILFAVTSNSIGQQTSTTQIFTVNSTLDTGDADLTDGICDDGNGNVTLRAAIEQANYSQLPTSIYFNIPGEGPHLIQPATPLPEIYTTLHIDGSTQPGSVIRTESSPPFYKIILDGSLIPINNVAGLDFTHSSVNSGVNFLQVQNFGIGTVVGNAIKIYSTHVTISRCYIKDNSSDGILIAGSNNMIGGENLEDCNVVSGYGTCISLFPEADNNSIVNNFLGTDLQGQYDDTEGWDGISIMSNNNKVFNNVISGNESNGVLLEAPQEHQLPVNNHIMGNLIGCSKDGTEAIPNGQGISINHSDNNLIERNIICGNNFHGILIYDQEWDWDHIYSSGNRITKNSIYGNGGLAIDLGNDWVTRNDFGDMDDGPNGLMNYPFIESAYLTSEGLQIKGYIDTPGSRNTTIEFFSSPKFDETVYGEGETYIGSVSPYRNGRFKVNLPAVPLGNCITATATDFNNNTSEYSQYVEVLELNKIFQSSRNLFIYDMKKGTSERLTTNGLGSEYNPGWSKSGKRIIHEVWDGYRNRLAITNVRTGIQKFIENTNDGNDAIWVDKNTILFDDWQNIYRMDLRSKKKELLIENAMSPTLSKNGKRLLYYKISDASIRTVNYKRMNDEVIVVPSVQFPNWRGARPIWSPNSKWIVFHDNGIWRVRVNKRGLPKSEPMAVILNGEYEYGFSDFTKDSKQLIIGSDYGSEFYGIWSINLDGSELTNILSDPTNHVYGARVSRNGRYFAYIAYDVFTLNKENRLTDAEIALPTGFSLNQNYPNPFNPTTTISFGIPGKGHVQLKVYDILGREVATLLNGIKEAGFHKAAFNSEGLSSGIYIYQLKYNERIIARKMSLLK